MFSNALLILPDFALILIGWALARIGALGLNRGFWIGAEKLVYYVMFPALLFSSISAARFSLVDDARLIAAAIIAFLAAAALAFAARPLLRPPAELFASCVQTAFRFNTYLALAVAQALLGAPGVALLALILAFAVPLANLFAVLALARQKRAGVLPELARNPLLVSTIAGLAANLLGLKLPVFAATIIGRLGSASIALGLLCVGAGLVLRAVQAERAVLAYFTGIKLVAFPLIAVALARALELPAQQTLLVTIFAAAPTATSAYVLAARMGVNAAPVAFLISAQTLLSMVTLPLWIGLVAR